MRELNSIEFSLSGLLKGLGTAVVKTGTFIKNNAGVIATVGGLGLTYYGIKKQSELQKERLKFEKEKMEFEKQKQQQSDNIQPQPSQPQIQPQSKNLNLVLIIAVILLIAGIAGFLFLKWKKK